MVLLADAVQNRRTIQAKGSPSVPRIAQLVVIVLLFLSCLASAQELKPFQQQALDQILAGTPPEGRAAVGAQLRPMLGMLNEEQVRAMLAKFEAQQREQQAAQAAQAEAEAQGPAVASPEDHAYNRAQWEPAVRQAWQAQKAFDEHVDARLAQACGEERNYAVYGSAWRYEVYPLQPNWQRASNSPELDVQVIGSSYAEKDGPYEFDFSAVRSDFDRATVDAAIDRACADYDRIGEQFLATARAQVVNDYLPNGMELEAAANAKLEPVRAGLEEALKAQSPSGDGALFQALLNAQPKG